MGGGVAGEHGESSATGIGGGLAIVHVRSSNGSKISVETNLDVNVGDFKVVLAGKCDVLAEQQRLIYKGRILKDEQTLASYGKPFIPYCPNLHSVMFPMFGLPKFHVLYD